MVIPNAGNILLIENDEELAEYEPILRKEIKL